jgi:diguanylate cyclase (GGDEF)-like protein/PAS domain S-box-containing protein
MTSVDSRARYAYVGVNAVVLVGALLTLPADVALLAATVSFGLTGAITTVRAARTRRPATLRAWHRIAAALLFAAIASILNLAQSQGMIGAGRPSAADVATLVSFACLAHGLMHLLPDRDRAYRRAGLLDALLAAVALGLLAWTFAARSSADLHGTPYAELAVALGYSLLSLVLLSSCVQLWNRTRVSHPAARMVVLAMVVLVATNMAYASVVFAGVGGDTVGVTAAITLGWLVYLALMGSAALHPSMQEAPRTARAPTTAAWERLATHIILTGFVPIVVVAGDQLNDHATNWPALVLGETAMVAILLVRMSDINNDLRGALRREFALRRANDKLVAAVDVAQVRRILVESAEELLATRLSRVWLVEDPRVAGFRPAPGEESSQVHVLRERGDLHETINAPHGDPLVVAEMPTRSAQALALVIATRDQPTTALVSAIDALTQCAALALDRISLGDRVLEQQSEERIQRLLQDASDVVAVLDPTLSIRYVTPAVERMLGRTSVDVTGANWLAYVRREDRDAARQMIERSNLGWPARGELQLTARDGTLRFVDVAVSRIADVDGGGFTIACHDITQRHELEQQLTHQAFHDPLTGLANRALFQNRLRHTVERSRRTGGRFAVLFIDLDDFKTVNDSLGHAAGDSLLRTVGTRISETLRAQDTAARFGGDEFAVILEDLLHDDEAADIAHRLIDELALPVQLGGAEVGVGASVGIAPGGSAADDPDALMRNADLALFEAKAGGKARSAVFVQTMHDTAMDRLQLKAEMRRALNQNEFLVEYQPLFSLDDEQRVLGVEALVRWDHPTRGRLTPSQFVTMAEETGLVVPLGLTVLNDAFATTARLQQLPGQESLMVAVNLSGRQLLDSSIVQTVRDALLSSGVDPATVVLEITESVLLPDGGVTVERLIELTTLGVRLYIDDFGTGYSSLAYLRDLPVSGIKLAREFVEPLPGTAAESGLVRTIQALAETLGLEHVVAEGIETAAQRDALIGLGYRVGQGYFLARPSDEDGIRALLLERGGTDDCATAAAGAVAVTTA